MKVVTLKAEPRESLGSADSRRARREGRLPVAVYADGDAAALTALGLHALQHRGQDAAGIVTWGEDGLNQRRSNGLVRDVFDSVAGRYDIMNDLMSAGLHRLWKRFTVEQAAVREGAVVLDLAGGTGDLARAFCAKVGGDGLVVLADINAAMLRQGRSRLVDAGVAGNLAIAQVNAEALPFADGAFDVCHSAMVLHHVEDPRAALREMARVVTPGGRVVATAFCAHDETWMREELAYRWLG